jgi:hypothetical protein
MLERIIEKVKKQSNRDPEPLFESRHRKLYGNYELVITPLSFGKNCWDYLAVEILDPKTGDKFGEYYRNYCSFYETFHPFIKNGKEYALYSRDYTATRVMSLPDCKGLGGEEPKGDGFCPVGYYVPQPDDDESNLALDGSFGFISGCVWGDDGSWKIQFLNLSHVEAGIIERSEKFGYVGLINKLSLKESIDVSGFKSEYPYISIAAKTQFHL